MVKEIEINKRKIGGNNPTYIIAEIARTYNNNLRIAEKMIKEAAKAGVDAIKIQSIEADELLVRNFFTEKHYQELKKLERTFAEHKFLFKTAQKYGIDFLSTPESLRMVDLLEKIGVKAYKIASLNLVYYDLLKRVAQTKKPIFLSTGMGTLDEIHRALRTIRAEGNNKIILLYCTSLYPPESEELDLRTIETFKKKFNVIVGFSDHTPEITPALAAVALGAKVIEKHFTLDRSQIGTDHKVSLEPAELKEMVKEIRKLEKMLGSGKKILSKREEELRKIKRRKIVAAKDLKKGTRLKKELLKFKQLDKPIGIEPQYENKVIGKILKIDIKKDEPIIWKIIQ